MERSLGPHHAATSIPRRLIVIEGSVLSQHGEFQRILIHEIFHFAWVRLSNDRRRSWEQVVMKEISSRVRGELGWSAEMRKERLQTADLTQRTIAWRHYACESFCDTAAYLYGELEEHGEFTLPQRVRNSRLTWFKRELASDALPI